MLTVLIITAELIILTSMKHCILNYADGVFIVNENLGVHEVLINRYKSSSSSTTTTPTNAHAEENNDNQADDTEHEFTNPFCTSVHEVAESSSRNIGNSNMHTFNQPQDSEYRWTKDHPLTQVRGNPSKPVQTRRQLATDPKMCMFALTMSTAELKNIKEAGLYCNVIRRG
ncbi:hypothetical protein Tco_0360908 [Tanacetum coccineum]